MRKSYSHSYSYAVAALAPTMVVGWMSIHTAGCDANGQLAGSPQALAAAPDELPDECAGCPSAPGAPAPVRRADTPGRGAQVEAAAVERVAIDVSRAPRKGEASAPVTVVVYSDFQCPFCKRGAQSTDELLAKFGRDVRVVFKHLPLPFHDRAPHAARAAIAAQNQEKFWPMHDRLFASGAKLDDDALIEHARALGLDVERFRRDLDDPTTTARLEADQAEARALGVQGTPTFFVNGEKLVGAQPLEAFTPLVQRALAAR